MKISALYKNVDLNKKNDGQLSEQLSCPHGDDGISVGKQMFESNRNMILSSIDAVQLENKNRLLEIGHGNCSHLIDIMQKALYLKYYGLERSELMCHQAEKNNVNYVKKRRASFQYTSGDKIPYVFNFFDRIVTVNTIYFWEKPVEFLKDIYRVLKPEGICVLTFVDGDFMKDLPFVNSSFTLYNQSKLVHLVSDTEFDLIALEAKKELVESKDGKMVNREYTIATLKKSV